MGDDNSTQQTPAVSANPEPESYLHSIATSLGIDPEAVKDTARAVLAHPHDALHEISDEAATELENAATHPLDTLKQAATGVVDQITNPEAAKVARARYNLPGVGNKAAGVAEAIGSAVPLIGGNIVKSQEQAVRGNLPGAAGTLTGTLAPVALEEGARQAGEAVHEAGAAARENMAARHEASLQEARTGKVIEMPGAPKELPAAPKALPAAPVAEAPVKISTDNLGIKWAENKDGIRVSIPKSVASEDVPAYAQQKLTEQADAQATLKNAPHITFEEAGGAEVAPPSQATNIDTTAVEPQFKQTLASRGQLPGQTVNLSPAGSTYVGHQLEARKAMTNDSLKSGYIDAVGTTTGSDLLPIPPRKLDFGQTPEAVIAHEMGHALELDRMGEKWGTGIESHPLEVMSHLHPDISGATAAIMMPWDKVPGATLGKNGAYGFNADALKTVLPDLLRVYAAGRVMANLTHGTPIGAGAAGDVADSMRMMRSAGFTNDEVKDMLTSIHNELHQQWNNPDILNLIRGAAAGREEGLSKTLHMSSERLQNIRDRVRQLRQEAPNGQEASNTPASAGAGSAISTTATEPGGAGLSAEGNLREGNGEAVSPVAESRGEKAVNQNAAAGFIRPTGSNELTEAAIKKYGVTDNPTKMGFILPDGRGLDFSEGRPARTLDHGDVSSILPRKGDNAVAYNENPREVFADRTGAARILISRDGVNIVLPESGMTSEQNDVILRAAEKHPGDVTIDIRVKGKIGSASGSVTDADSLDRLVRDAKKDARAPGAGTVSVRPDLESKAYDGSAELKRARSRGMQVISDLAAGQPGAGGWIAPDGKNKVVVYEGDHDGVASVLNNTATNKVFDASSALSKRGWIRQTAGDSYDVDTVSPQNVAIIEKAAIESGYAGKPLYIDYGWTPKTGTKSIEVPAGWTDLDREPVIKKLLAKTFSVRPNLETKSAETEPNTAIQESAQKYAAAQGMPEIKHIPVIQDLDRARAIAQQYEAAKHNPNDPQVKAAYDALKSETKAQFHHLRDDLGLKFEPTDKDPYVSAQAMMHDIRQNNRLKVFTGSSTGADHPLSEIDPETGESYNTLFRWVHDAYGHAAGGNDFSENGEKSATEAHAQMYSPAARPAMRAETEGQTSHFFHNPAVESGAKQPGEFAPQKATLIPDWNETAGARAAKEPAGGINPRTGQEDKTGLGVEIYPELRQQLDHAPTSADFQKFYEQHKGLFDQNPELRVGWDNDSHGPGGHEINIGAVGPGAVKVAGKLDQYAAYDIAKGKNIDAGGTGKQTQFPDYPLEDRLKDLRTEPESFEPGKVLQSKPELFSALDTAARKKLAMSYPKGSTPALQKYPLTIEGTADSGHATILDFAGAMNKWAQQGLKPNKEIAAAMDRARAELKYQLANDNSGLSWYKKDTADAIDTLKANGFPELKTPLNAKVFRTLWGITSYGVDPDVNMTSAAEAWKQYQKTGKIPLKANSITNWPGYSGIQGSITLLNKLIDEKGEQGAMDWLYSKHPVSEIREQKMKTHGTAGVPGKADDEKYGAFIFGPKAGAYTLNLQGVSDHTTVDVWGARMIRRWTGTLTPESMDHVTPKEARDFHGIVDSMGKDLGLDNSTVQAVLWQYEHDLYATHGVGEAAKSYKGAAEKYVQRQQDGSTRDFIAEQSNLFAERLGKARDEAQATRQNALATGSAGGASQSGQEPSEVSEAAEPEAGDTSFDFGANVKSQKLKRGISGLGKK